MSLQELKKQLLEAKQTTEAEYNKIIHDYARKNLVDKFKESGLDVEDLPEEEFEALLQEEIRSAKSFSKGVLAASGVFLFLELLG